MPLQAEQAPRLPNPNCCYDSEAERAPRSPNPNRHLHGEAERAPRLLNPNCHDDSEAQRAPRLPNPNCHCGGEAPSLPSLSQMRFPASVCPRKQRVFFHATKWCFGSQEERGLAERNLFSKQFAHRFRLKSVQNVCPENCVSEKTKGVLQRNFDALNIALRSKFRCAQLLAFCA